MKTGGAVLLGVIIGIVAWLWVQWWPYAGVNYTALGLVSTGFYFAHGGAWKAAPIAIMGTIMGTVFAIITLVLFGLFAPGLGPTGGLFLAVVITTTLAALVTMSGVEVLSSLPTVLGIWAAELMVLLQVLKLENPLDWGYLGQFLYAGIVGVLFVGLGIFYPNKWISSAIWGKG